MQSQWFRKLTIEINLGTRNGYKMIIMSSFLVCKETILSLTLMKVIQNEIQEANFQQKLVSLNEILSA